ncbi:homoserine kinase [Bifidobacterium gallicum]|uniref:Homoserine kinase n=1 Tax=Bifidobacterium gallicum DSM 20093 = LMG 11596 TaxID=561180 RepID=D1NWN4_9BIFI|nr:homoserine kinase [Bifidobacterium gallicum]EFA22193.1 homoserine kinase [Bifidobacterium gallicum DSM 20093 = LMG 11596]
MMVQSETTQESAAAVTDVAAVKDVAGAVSATKEPVCEHVHVRVPATSANLGSGFDTLGLGLEYFDDLDFTLTGADVQVDIEGEGAQTLPRDASHLVVKSFLTACERLGLGRPGVRLQCVNRIPQARGMGSSAEAIVAGVSAAAAFAGKRTEQGDLDRDWVFAVAAELEGHPDNVAPAVYGSMTASWSVDAAGFRTISYPVAPTMLACVFIPNFELSTSAARQVLPTEVPFSDAIANVSHVALMPAAMAGGAQANKLLFDATQDALHQPYRLTLMEPSAALIATMRQVGYAACVSGAGPCVLVLHDCAGSSMDDVSQAIDAAAREHLDSGIWRVLHLPINTTGVHVD